MVNKKIYEGKEGLDGIFLENGKCGKNGINGKDGIIFFRNLKNKQVGFKKFNLKINKFDIISDIDDEI
jgi:hypothetical protein